MNSTGQKRRLRIPKLDVRGFFALVIQAGKAWSVHRVPRMGAALSYYTAFSLAPLLVLVLSVASLVVIEQDKVQQKNNVQETEKSYSIFGYHLRQAPSQYIVDEVKELMGDNGAAGVQEILSHASSTRVASWSTLFSFVVLLIGASGAFGELQDSLNQIWEVKSKENAFFIMLKERALSFAMVFVLGFFMLVSLVLSAFIAGLSHMVVAQFPAVGLEMANTVISFVVFSGLFCVIFRLLPDVPLNWSDVWPGAIFSSALFILGKFMLGWYIGFSSTSFSRYGAAGSFIVILVWVFYSAQILFMGAEFSRAYTLKYGSHRDKKPPSLQETKSA